MTWSDTLVDNEWQRRVESWRMRVGLPVGNYRRPTMPADPVLHASLLREECQETAAALVAGDMVETIDGVCDVIFVALGIACEMGIDLDPFFVEVCRSNNTKVGAPRNAAGKIGKGEKFEAPRIAQLLDAVRARGQEG